MTTQLALGSDHTFYIMKVGCWAESLGDCVGKLSGEHIVSETIWTGPKVTAEGGPWPDGPREIGVASLTAKILCQSHNSRLSVVDAAGGSAFRTITQGIALTNARQRIPPREWMRHCFDPISGPLLERWFIKTAINVALVLKHSPIWGYDAATGKPPRDLVEMAFGLQPVPRPIGLYAAAAIGDNIQSNEEVRCHLLYSEPDHVAGATFVFRGFNFVLNLTPVAIQGIFEGAAPKVLRTRDELFYHVNRINSDVNGYRSHFVDFMWPGSDFAHFSP